MPGKSTFCIVRTRQQAEQIFERLQAAGFPARDISLLMPDQKTARSAAKGKQPAVAAGNPPNPPGRLVGVRQLNVPEFGLCLAAGPVALALGAAAAGASSMGIARVLAGMGVAEPDARRYEDKIEEGNILIAAHAGNSDDGAAALHIFETEEADYFSTAEESPAENQPQRTQESFHSNR